MLLTTIRCQQKLHPTAAMTMTILVGFVWFWKLFAVVAVAVVVDVDVDVAVAVAVAVVVSATTSATTTTTPIQQRQTVSFDFGWKHRAGLHEWPEDPFESPINTTATTGFAYIDPGNSPREASVGHDYDTSEWIDVKLPHDGIISNPYGNSPSQKACPDGCSGRSYIPRHVLWYRNEFNTPTTTAVRASMEIRSTFEIEDWDNEAYYCYRFTVRETDEDHGDGEGHGPRIFRTSLQPLVFLSSPANNHNDVVSISITVTERLLLTNPKLWTSSHPHLYDVTAHLYGGCGTTGHDGEDDEPDANANPALFLDEVTVQHGIRSIRFDPNSGFYWNEAPYKIRGFCDHDTFAVVGMAVPDRINLFRVSRVLVQSKRERTAFSLFVTFDSISVVGILFLYLFFILLILFLSFSILLLLDFFACAH
jgi:hypothetical protein